MTQRPDNDGLPADLHRVTVTKLPSTTCLLLAVDAHRPLHEQGLGLRAVVDEVGELEELTEPDGLVADLDRT